ncbi:MAG: hypothetical protein AB8C02_18075 [Halioglobus sp.]
MAQTSFNIALPSAIRTRYTALVCLLAALFLASAQVVATSGNQVPDYTAPVYEDSQVVVHEIKTPFASYTRVFLRAVHKVDANTELFDVQRTRNSDGQIAYKYGDGVYEQAKKWLGERYSDPAMEALFITHFVANTELKAEPTLANADWKASYGPGRPVSMYQLFNRSRRKGKDPVDWKPSYALPMSDHTIVGRGYLNTLSQAQAWQVNMPATQLNAVRREKLQASNEPQDNPLAAFGYGSATPLGAIGNVRYFLTPSRSAKQLDVAALHTELGEEDHIVELDPLLTRNERGDYVLSYLLTPQEIQRFNGAFGQKLRDADSSASLTQVRHYVAGKSAGKRYNPWNGTSKEAPAFAQTYYWHEGKNAWRPNYEKPNTKNQSGIGRFDYNGTRYSIQSTRAYIEYLNEKERKPSLRLTETPVEELNAALASGSDTLRKRHKKYALWSDGYWAFHEIPIALDVINGNFERVDINRDFRYLFVNFMRAYAEACQAYIVNPQILTYTLTEKEMDAHGFTVSEDVTTVSVVLPADYVKTYDFYWNNGPDRAAVLVAAFKSFSRSNKTPGVASEFFRSSAYLNAAQTMLHVDACNEPAPQRLLTNLLRRAKGEEAIRSGITLPTLE